jgi:hypothetical protein
MRVGEYREGSKGKRDRKKLINRERNIALESSGNCVGCKIDQWD